MPQRTTPSAMALHILAGKDAHVGTKTIFDGLEWSAAGVRHPGAPHTIYELLGHMIYWQDFGIARLEGASPRVPVHAAASWPVPTAPESADEWAQAVARYKDGLKRLESLARTPLETRPGKKPPLLLLATIASHNSYHAGQVVMLRQMAGAWPPPSGGFTW